MLMAGPADRPVRGRSDMHPRQVLTLTPCQPLDLNRHGEHRRIRSLRGSVGPDAAALRPARPAGPGRSRPELGLDELRGMLILRRAQVAEQIDADLVRLDAIERRLRTIESEGNMSEYEFVENPLPAVRLAQLTATVRDSGAISAWMGPAYERLVAALETAGAPPDAPAISWYD